MAHRPFMSSDDIGVPRVYRAVDASGGPTHAGADVTRSHVHSHGLTGADRAARTDAGIPTSCIGDAVLPQLIQLRSSPSSGVSASGDASAPSIAQPPTLAPALELGRWLGVPAHRRLWSMQSSISFHGVAAALVVIGLRATDPDTHTHAHGEIAQTCEMLMGADVGECVTSVSVQLLRVARGLLRDEQKSSDDRRSLPRAGAHTRARTDTLTHSRKGILARMCACLLPISSKGTPSRTGPVDARGATTAESNTMSGARTLTDSAHTHTHTHANRKVVPSSLLDHSSHESEGAHRRASLVVDAGLHSCGIGCHLREEASLPPDAPRRTATLPSPRKAVGSVVTLNLSLGDVLHAVCRGLACCVDQLYAPAQAAVEALVGDLDTGAVQRPDVAHLAEGSTLLDSGWHTGAGSTPYTSPGFGLHGSPGIGATVHPPSEQGGDTATRRSQSLFTVLLAQPVFRRLADALASTPAARCKAVRASCAVLAATRCVAALCALPDACLLTHAPEATAACITWALGLADAPAGTSSADVGAATKMLRWSQLHTPTGVAAAARAAGLSRILRTLLTSMWRGDAVATPPLGGLHPAVISAVMDCVVGVSTEPSGAAPEAVPRLSELLRFTDATTRSIMMHGSFTAALSEARVHAAHLVIGGGLPEGVNGPARPSSRDMPSGLRSGSAPSHASGDPDWRMPEPASRPLRVLISRDAPLRDLGRDCAVALPSNVTTASTAALVASIVGGTARVLHPTFVHSSGEPQAPAPPAASLRISTRRGHQLAGAGTQQEEGEGHGPRKELFTAAMEDAMAAWGPWQAGPGWLRAIPGEDAADLFVEQDAAAVLASESIALMLQSAQVRVTLPDAPEVTALVTDVRIVKPTAGAPSNSSVRNTLHVARLRLDTAFPRQATNAASVPFALRRSRVPLFRRVVGVRTCGVQPSQSPADDKAFECVGWLLGAALLNRVTLPVQLSAQSMNRVLCAAWAHGVKALSTHAAGAAERALQAAILRLLVEAAEAHDRKATSHIPSGARHSSRTAGVTSPFEPCFITVSSALEHAPDTLAHLSDVYTCSSAALAANFDADDLVLQLHPVQGARAVPRTEASLATGVRNVPLAAPMARHAYAVHVLSSILDAAESRSVEHMGAGLLGAIGLAGLAWLGSHGVTGADLALMLSGDAQAVDDAPEASPGKPLDRIFRIVYDDEARECTPLRDAFVRIVNGMTTRDQRQFLRFVTGVAAYPTPDTEVLRVETPFTAFGRAQHEKLLAMLPQAHSCTNTLELPNYFEALRVLKPDAPESVLADECSRIMTTKLLQAIHLTEGYGLDTLPGASQPSRAAHSATDVTDKRGHALPAVREQPAAGDAEEEPRAAFSTPARARVIVDAPDSAAVSLLPTAHATPAQLGVMGPGAPSCASERAPVTRDASSAALAPRSASADSASELADLAAEVEHVLRHTDDGRSTHPFAVEHTAAAPAEARVHVVRPPRAADRSLSAELLVQQLLDEASA